MSYYYLIEWLNRWISITIEVKSSQEQFIELFSEELLEKALTAYTREYFLPEYRKMNQVAYQLHFFLEQATLKASLSQKDAKVRNHCYNSDICHVVAPFCYRNTSASPK